MLFILTVLVVLLAVVTVTVFVKRRIDRDLIESSEPRNLVDTNLRPLFEADEEEVRDPGALDSVVIETESVDDEKEKKLAKLEEFRQTWGENPDKRNTIELLAAASETGVAEMYAAEASEVTGRFRKSGIGGLTAADLADLLETHLWLLPAGERMSGSSFVVKQEIADLRSERK
jgi:hypothetical protein